MKKHSISTLCLSLLLAGSYARAHDAAAPVSQLSQTIDQSIFSPSSPLKLTHQEISMLTNLTLMMYMDAHYTLRSHMTELSAETTHRKEVISKTCNGCVSYIKAHGSEQLKLAVNLLEHNTKALKRTYLNKYQDELISGERDSFVHAQALEQVTINLFGIWYAALYDGMKRNNFEASCFTLSFGVNGFIPETSRTGQMPAPQSLMQ